MEWWGASPRASGWGLVTRKSTPVNTGWGEEGAAEVCRPWGPHQLWGVSVKTGWTCWTPSGRWRERCCGRTCIWCENSQKGGNTRGRTEVCTECRTNAGFSGLSMNKDVKYFTNNSLVMTTCLNSNFDILG